MKVRAFEKLIASDQEKTIEVYEVEMIWKAVPEVVAEVLRLRTGGFPLKVESRPLMLDMSCNWDLKMEWSFGRDIFFRIE